MNSGAHFIDFDESIDVIEPSINDPCLQSIANFLDCDYGKILELDESHVLSSNPCLESIEYFLDIVELERNESLPLDMITSTYETMEESEPLPMIARCCAIDTSTGIIPLDRVIFENYNVINTWNSEDLGPMMFPENPYLESDDQYIEYEFSKEVMENDIYQDDSYLQTEVASSIGHSDMDLDLKELPH